MTIEKTSAQAITGLMNKTLSVLTEQFAGIKQAVSPSLVENIKVEYYGSQTPLQQLASITQPHPNSILVSIYDASVVKDA